MNESVEKELFNETCPRCKEHCEPLLGDKFCNTCQIVQVWQDLPNKKEDGAVSFPFECCHVMRSFNNFYWKDGATWNYFNKKSWTKLNTCFKHVMKWLSKISPLCSNCDEILRVSAKLPRLTMFDIMNDWDKIEQVKYGINESQQLKLPKPFWMRKKTPKEKKMIFDEMLKAVVKTKKE